MHPLFLLPNEGVQSVFPYAFEIVDAVAVRHKRVSAVPVPNPFADEFFAIAACFQLPRQNATSDNGTRRVLFIEAFAGAAGAPGFSVGMVSRTKSTVNSTACDSWVVLCRFRSHALEILPRKQSCHFAKGAISGLRRPQTHAQSGYGPHQRLRRHNMELSRPAASTRHQQFIQTQPVLPVDILGDGSNDLLCLCSGVAGTLPLLQTRSSLSSHPSEGWVTKHIPIQAPLSFERERNLTTATPVVSFSGVAGTLPLLQTRSSLSSHPSKG